MIMAQTDSDETFSTKQVVLLVSRREQRPPKLLLGNVKINPPVNPSRETTTTYQPEIVSVKTAGPNKKLGRPRKSDMQRSCADKTGRTVDGECMETEAVGHSEVDVKMEEDSQLSDGRWLGPGDTIEDIWRRHKKEIDRGSSVQKSGFMMNQ